MNTEASGSAAHISIIGASASGLYLAGLLAKAGREVTVYERSKAFHPAPRALIVTSALVDVLGDLATPAIVNQVDRYQLYANGKVGEIALGRPDLIIEREALVKHLAEIAVASGAIIETGSRFIGFEAQRNRIHLRIVRNDETSESLTDVLIGADGASSLVARVAGWRPQPTVPLLQAIVTTPESLPMKTSRVWFVPEDTPYFYWLIPEGPRRAALGVIGEHAKHLRPRLDRFLERKGLEPIEYQGARIPRYARWRRVRRQVQGCDIFLVGDAAGQVKVSTVGGIVTGFRGAQAVADAILGVRSKKSLRDLRMELDTHLLIRKAIHGFQEADYCRLLDLLNAPTRRSLQDHTRDEAVSILWRVLLKQPSLVSLSVRGLIR